MQYLLIISKRIFAQLSAAHMRMQINGFTQLSAAFALAVTDSDMSVLSFRRIGTVPGISFIVLCLKNIGLELLTFPKAFSIEVQVSGTILCRACTKGDSVLSKNDGDKKSGATNL